MPSCAPRSAESSSVASLAVASLNRSPLSLAMRRLSCTALTLVSTPRGTCPGTIRPPAPLKASRPPGPYMLSSELAGAPGLIVGVLCWATLPTALAALLATPPTAPATRRTSSTPRPPACATLLPRAPPALSSCWPACVRFIWPISRSAGPAG